MAVCQLKCHIRTWANFVHANIAAFAISSIPLIAKNEHNFLRFSGKIKLSQRNFHFELNFCYCNLLNILDSLIINLQPEDIVHIVSQMKYEGIQLIS
jgi:hypothetical protein